MPRSRLQVKSSPDAPSRHLVFLSSSVQLGLLGDSLIDSTVTRVAASAAIWSTAVSPQDHFRSLVYRYFRVYSHPLDFTESHAFACLITSLAFEPFRYITSSDVVLDKEPAPLDHKRQQFCPPFDYLTQEKAPFSPFASCYGTLHWCSCSTHRLPRISNLVHGDLQGQSLPIRLKRVDSSSLESPSKTSFRLVHRATTAAVTTTTTTTTW
ncbi:hypothetical protein CEP52_012348 [Fusarium oligoseptatum]|uniref:Uncharacterized protein n=1 Tax=Fusarium oligoseptatum TaxID=2604345 RepID=A0A428SYS6_9HYPO|nr:hypothetical protein CEP52_012348 [Fusarium oligoseptatum]